MTASENHTKNSCDLGLAHQSKPTWSSSLELVNAGVANGSLRTLFKAHLKEKLMKALLIIIPVTIVILIIVLCVKRKRESLYRKRRKFWLQEKSKSKYQPGTTWYCTTYWRVAQYLIGVFISRYWMPKPTESNQKQKHIIAERDDRQVTFCPISANLQIKNFYRQKIKTYIHFDLHVTAGQVKSFLFSYSIVIIIGSL